MDMLIRRREMMIHSLSPYDILTTEYFKATYPSYWGLIQSYGLSHPSLVPYINNDNDLICSLVDLGYTRWLVGDGSSYIRTGIVPNTDTISELLLTNVGSASYRSFIGRGDTWNSSDHYAIAVGNNGIRLGLYMSGTDVQPNTIIERTDIVRAYNISVTGFSFENKTKHTSGYGSTGKTTLGVGSGRDLYIFSDNCPDNNLKNPIVASIAYCKIGSANFVPCKDIYSSKYGMLELNNVQFFPNAGNGAFSVSKTTTI